MRIHEDHNGVIVNSIHKDPLGNDVSGHQYVVIAGTHTSYVDFQFGPVKENGLNGVTNEALLAILLDRTKYLNSKFPCEENKAAIIHMQAALDFFELRTKSRIQRGVEGQNKV
jgi:hypothetical protein